MLRSFAGDTLFGELWGSGPTRVVALHGWRRTHADFAQALGPGSAGGALAVVAVDLPGFGSTPPPRDAWGSEDYAACVAQLVEEVSGASGPVVLVGHSLGGRVAARLAANRPELVGALVLCGAPLVRPEGAKSNAPLGYRVVRSLRRLGVLSEARLERARRHYGSPDYADSEGVMRDVLVRVVNESYERTLGAIGCPVELVWGADDSEVPLSTARAIEERLENAHLTVCPGGGHLLPSERPEALRAAVERALARSAGDDAAHETLERRAPEVTS